MNHVMLMNALRACTVSCCLLGFCACKQRQGHWLTDGVTVYALPEQHCNSNAVNSSVVPVVKPIGEPVASNNKMNHFKTTGEEVFKCTCRVMGKEINCQLVNCSSSCVLYDHQVTGPEYYLDYVDKNGVRRMEQTALVESICFPHLVALSAYPADGTFVQGAIHSFNVPVPADCKKILSLTFLISYVPFSELSSMRNIGDLRVAFMRYRVKVTATFESIKRN